jgi:hypothetical protein
MNFVRVSPNEVTFQNRSGGDYKVTPLDEGAKAVYTTAPNSFGGGRMQIPVKMNMRQ